MDKLTLAFWIGGVIALLTTIYFGRICTRKSEYYGDITLEAGLTAAFLFLACGLWWGAMPRTFEHRGAVSGIQTGCVLVFAVSIVLIATSSWRHSKRNWIILALSALAVAGSTIWWFQV